MSNHIRLTDNDVADLLEVARIRQAARRRQAEYTPTPLELHEQIAAGNDARYRDWQHVQEAKSAMGVIVWIALGMVIGFAGVAGLYLAYWLLSR